MRYALAISERLEFHGAWFFQMKEAGDGELKLMEVAPRIGGTMATHRVLGINFPLLSIYESMGMPVTLLLNDHEVEIDRSLHNRFKHSVKYDTIYVDFDDTLIIRDRVNTTLLGFLYDAKSMNKKIVLITRSALDIAERLNHYAISAKLFDEIHHIDLEQKKSKFITDKNSIFIDDSFKERMEVSGALGIETFDCSMVEMLI